MDGQNGEVEGLQASNLRFASFFHEEQDPDPQKSETSDPDPHQSGKSDPDPHQSEKTDPDPGRISDSNPKHSITAPDNNLVFFSDD